MLNITTTNDTKVVFLSKEGLELLKTVIDNEAMSPLQKIQFLFHKSVFASWFEDNTIESIDGSIYLCRYVYVHYEKKNSFYDTYITNLTDEGLLKELSEEKIVTFHKKDIGSDTQIKMSVHQFGIFSNQTINQALIESNNRFSKLKAVNDKLLEALSILKEGYKYTADEEMIVSINKEHGIINKELDYHRFKMEFLVIISDNNLFSEEKVVEAYRRFRDVQPEEEMNVTVQE